MRHGCDDREIRRAMKMAARVGRQFGASFGSDGPFGQHGPFGAHGPFGPDGAFGRGGGGRGGRGRMFASGELRLVLLRLVAEQSRHGYDLIKAIEALTGGEYAPSPGVVYPTLQMMLDEGVIAEVPDDTARKVFSATDAGTTDLEAQKDAIDAVMQRLSAIGEERHSSPHRQVHRAMENLRNALRHQRAAGGLQDEMVAKIVDLIDEAARQIERL
ncbi:MAG: PadR family transcriptional regulator [Croceibacterium sp.]